MRNAMKVIKSVGEAYAKFSGRRYGIFEEYLLEDAEVALVALGSAAGTMKAVIRELRAEGVKIGLLKPRVFRPFPQEEIVEALAHLKAAAIFDRSDTFAGGMGGPLFIETRSSFYEAKQRPLLLNYIYGLGGRDLNQELIKRAAQKLIETAESGEIKQTVNYLGLRE